MNDFIPTDLTEFFWWLKRRTEEVWSQYRTKKLEESQQYYSGWDDWQQGTKWLGGFSDDEINSFEQVWQIKFPPDYRQFLRFLGAPDRPMYSVWYATDSHLAPGERPSFYNWRTDGEAIKRAMAWPLEGLLFDVERNDLWLNSWGVRPNDAGDRQQRLSTLVREAPALIPIFAHRYLLGVPVRAGNPILSVHQSDIILYGSNIRNYLIAELSELLGFDQQNAWRKAVEGVSIESIPFWGEIMNG